MSDCVLVYITAPNVDQAGSLGRMLLERRLAACVNIIPGVRSLYWWQGEITEDQEVVLIAKTLAERVGDLESAVKQAHSYQVPAILVLRVERGEPAYLAWLAGEVGRGRS